MSSQKSMRAARHQAFFKLSQTAACFALAWGMVNASANPSGGQVVAGSASIAASGPNKLNIHQSSDRAIINWHSFDIGAGGHVQFHQPSASSVTLNRVTGGAGASVIAGQLSANGGIYLVNPEGIYFGPGSKVNVGSLIATTNGIRNADFMAGKLRFDQPGKAGAQVVTQGHITVAEGGLAAFVAPQVRNSGVIQAHLGRVALAAGDAFTLDLYGDQLLSLVLPTDALSTLLDANGEPLSRRIDNTGHIQADGGQVWLTAATVRNLVSGVVNLGGVVQAQSAHQDASGLIHLDAGTGGRATITGTAKAGQVALTGQEVTLTADAQLSAHNAQGQGGLIEVGGGFQGKGTLANASHTTVQAGARLTVGDKGRVIVWSEERTRFEGNVEAPGGFVEVSGRESLRFNGQVRADTLLLDPRYIVINDSSDPQNPADSAALDDVIGNQVINALLANGTQVDLLASDSIYVDAAIDGGSNSSKPGGGLSLTASKGLIALNNHIRTNNGPITLQAGTDILSATNTLLDAGSAAVQLQAGGNVSVQGVKAGSLQIESGQDITLAQPLGGNDVVKPEVGWVDLKAGGNIELNGLNLAGRMSTTEPGLRVVADDKITSNAVIAINDGSLIFGNDKSKSILLKASIYSRNGRSIDVYPQISLSVGEELQSCFNANINACTAKVPGSDFEQTPGGVTTGIITLPKITISNNLNEIEPTGDMDNQTIRLMRGVTPSRYTQVTLPVRVHGRSACLE